MQFKENTHVYTAGGQDVGKIKRVVVDPNTKDLTHLVVQKGSCLPKIKWFHLMK